MLLQDFMDGFLYELYREKWGRGKWWGVKWGHRVLLLLHNFVFANTAGAGGVVWRDSGAITKSFLRVYPSIYVIINNISLAPKFHVRGSPPR